MWAFTNYHCHVSSRKNEHPKPLRTPATPELHEEPDKDTTQETGQDKPSLHQPHMKQDKGSQQDKTRQARASTPSMAVPIQQSKPCKQYQTLSILHGACGARHEIAWRLGYNTLKPCQIAKHQPSMKQDKVRRAFEFEIPQAQRSGQRQLSKAQLETKQCDEEEDRPSEISST